MKFSAFFFRPTMSRERLILTALLMIIAGIAIPIALLLLLLMSDCPS
jgi:hypothetical protein